ncbi:MAG: hypothetical protein R3B70_21130 [Polyangiaceae bacterium]
MRRERSVWNGGLALAGAAAILGWAGVAAGQWGPGQYAPQTTPYGAGQYTPYGQPQQGPYAQPLPYGQTQQMPGYQNLGNTGGNDMTADKAYSWPILRISPGVGVNLPGVGGRQIVPSDALPSFDLDVTVGYRFALSRRVFLAAEGGYGLNTEPAMGSHAGSVGVGPGMYLHRHFSVAWVPRFVIGETKFGLGMGARNTVLLQTLDNVINLEIGHQWLWSEQRDLHELRAQVGVDVAAIVHLYTVSRLGGR